MEQKTGLRPWHQRGGIFAQHPELHPEWTTSMASALNLVPCRSAHIGSAPKGMLIPVGSPPLLLDDVM